MNRTERLLEWVAGEHCRPRMNASPTPFADRPAYVLTDGCGVAVDAPRTPLIEQSIADFREFCRTCLGIDPGTAAAPAIRFRVDGGLAFDPLDPACQAFTLAVAADGVLLRAPHERGLAHGIHYVERLMADAGGPRLPPGTITRTPRFAPRITSVWGSTERLDERLALAAHGGADALHRSVRLFDLARNDVIPELAGDAVEERQEQLRADVARLARYGLDLYLCLNTKPLPADHPAFVADPARRGAPYRVFDDMAPQYVLCSGNPEVVAAHEAAVENLLRAVPDLAGAIFLVGGEGLMHCYTRPYGDLRGHSSCPRCAGTAPSGAVAALVNGLAAAVRRAGGPKPVFTWPYSAFSWSHEDRAQLAFLDALDPDVHLLANFDTNSPDVRNGAGVYLYDYNIKCVGPSAVFQAQADRRREQGRPTYAKTESNTTPEAYFTSYIPVPFRWHRRFREMDRVGVAGYMNQWFFYGLTGGPPEEMQYHAVWNPERDPADLLATVARRDFGLDPAAAAQAVEGWRLLSDAWDDFPYSAMTAGEREYYGRGPFHYGPAHPLIFNTQSRYGLPASFFGLSGDLKHLATPAEVEDLLKNAKPRYVSELLLALPYGIDRYLELLGNCRRQWAAGLALLTAAVGDTPTERARLELDTCTLFDVHLATLEHVVRFYDRRDRLGREPLDLAGFRAAVAELIAIARAEIANAERSLPIVERDFRIRPYDADMVREKIRQCRYVVEDELPVFDITMRFHVWNSAP